MRYSVMLTLVVLAAVAAILGALAFSAHTKPHPLVAGKGDLVYRQGSFVMRLTDEPCPFEQLGADLADQAIPPAKAYRELRSDGRWGTPWCWAKDMGGDVATRDTAGGEGTVPIDWFKREPGIEPSLPARRLS